MPDDERQPRFEERPCASCGQAFHMLTTASKAYCSLLCRAKAATARRAERKQPGPPMEATPDRPATWEPLIGARVRVLTDDREGWIVGIGKGASSPVWIDFGGPPEPPSSSGVAGTLRERVWRRRDELEPIPEGGLTCS